MRKDVREFIRRLETAGLTVEATPGTTAFSGTVSHSARRTGCLSCCRSHPTRLAGGERRSSSRASSVSTCERSCTWRTGGSFSIDRTATTLRHTRWPGDSHRRQSSGGIGSPLDRGSGRVVRLLGSDRRISPTEVGPAARGERFRFDAINGTGAPLGAPVLRIEIRKFSPRV